MPSHRFLFVLGALVMGAMLQSCTTTQGPWAHRDSYDQFHIVVAEDGSEDLQLAARELQDHWGEVTGHEIGISNQPAGHYNIWIGTGLLPQDYREQLKLEDLSEQGLALKTVDARNLVIAGGGDIGTLYGANEFIKTHLGVRWLSPRDTYIPPQPPATLANLDYRYDPIFEYRYTTYLWKEDQSEIYYRRHRLNSGPGFSCHTFYNLIPPEKYFAEHPEYFSMIDGKRVAPDGDWWRDLENWPGRHDQMTQLCMSNPEVVQLLIDRVREEIKNNPKKKWHHISQMDWANYCECGPCSELNEQEDTPMGSVMWALNQVAETISEEYPGHYIETLAYTYTRQPPKHMKPHPSLAIKLCSIEADFARPLDDPESELNRRFADDIRKWSAISNRLHIWDYTANYRNFQTPHPNFHVFKPNLNFFADHSVVGMFEQGSYDRGAEFAYLRAYLISELLWDPSGDPDAIMNEFIELYYGEAAPYIREYIDLITQKVIADEIVMGCFADGMFMTADMVERSRAIFEKAFAAVEDDEEMIERVRVASIPVEYAALMCPPQIAITEDTFTISRPPSMTLEEYTETLRGIGVDTIMDFFPFEDWLEVMNYKTPPRQVTSELVKLENERYEVWVTPGIFGTIQRWHDKQLDVELLRGWQTYGTYPGTWQEWVNTPGKAEHPPADEFEVVEKAENKLTLRTTLDDGMIIERTLILAPDSDQLEIQLTQINPTDQPLTPRIKIHPEFYAQGEYIPEIWARDQHGWEMLTEPPEEADPVSGKIIDASRYQEMAFFVPEAQLSVATRFNPAELSGLLYFYTSNRDHEHINLELIPKSDPVKPEERRTLTAYYSVADRRPSIE